MCWIDNKVPVEYTATSDVPVFKIGLVSNHNGNIIPYFYSRRIYKEGMLCKEPKRLHVHVQNKFGTNKKKCFIEKGLHSYSVENLRLKGEDYMLCGKTFPTVEIATYKTAPMSQGVISKGTAYPTHRLAILLCTIPKGAHFYVNSVGEMVSDKLKIHKILKMPFKYNVNGTVNKNSVNKINTLLNKWENLTGLK